jgi:hypothetical protein
VPNCPIAFCSAQRPSRLFQRAEQNQAIGYILDFNRMLGDALALYRAAVAPASHREGAMKCGASKQSIDASSSRASIYRIARDSSNFTICRSGGL